MDIIDLTLTSESEEEEDYDLSYLDEYQPKGIILCDDLLEMVGEFFTKLKRKQYLCPLITDINKLGGEFREDKYSHCMSCDPYPFVNYLYQWSSIQIQQGRVLCEALSTPELCKQYRFQTKHRDDDKRFLIADGIPTTEWAIVGGQEVERPYVDERDCSWM